MSHKHQSASTRAPPSSVGEMTVAKYLKQRLEELECTHLFTVAGNYCAPFLDTILQDGASTVQIVGVSNELIGGYAADGFARARGIGAVVTTYGVDAFNLLNPIAGSMAEQVPLVLINGAPTQKEKLNLKNTGLVSLPQLNDELADIEVFRTVTVSAQIIQNGAEAAAQIDAALTACITYSKPVYLEVAEDVWRAKCDDVGKPLTKQFNNIITNRKDTAVAAAKATLQLLPACKQPLIWAGIEIHRFGLQQQFLELLHVTGLRFATSLLGKSAVSEEHPQFVGVLSPTPTIPSQFTSHRSGIVEYDCLIGIGARTVAVDTLDQGSFKVLHVWY
jgi:indolepyruvate decarboxylase